MAQFDVTAEKMSEVQIPVVQLAVKRILVPVDGSSTSVEATNVAMGMAKCFNAEILAIFVDPGRTIDPMSELEQEAESGVMLSDAGLRVAQKSGEKNGITVKTMTREGAAGHEIIAAAKENDVDLIVMGTTGRTGLKKFMLGSVAESVLHEAHVPVLIVKKGSTPFCITEQTES